ncbi:hypothetical protein AWB65_06300 [Caballeronia humi]|uniref:Uncharacterized protein n=1 Tax=Caballeronia humi TaxID=326474 RepID=A0A158JBV1_9BURK|nr:hypothetical protein AWB65_06300 [Caballeronia humi]
MNKLVHKAQKLLAELDGFRVEIREADSRADIILDRPHFNIVSMLQREQLRVVFEALDDDPRVRVIVVSGPRLPPKSARPLRSPPATGKRRSARRFDCCFQSSIAPSCS